MSARLKVLMVFYEVFLALMSCSGVSEQQNGFEAEGDVGCVQMNENPEKRSDFFSERKYSALGRTWDSLFLHLTFPYSGYDWLFLHYTNCLLDVAVPTRRTAGRCTQVDVFRGSRPNWNKSHSYYFKSFTFA
jgi:hypothetical protein